MFFVNTIFLFVNVFATVILMFPGLSRPDYSSLANVTLKIPGLSRPNYSTFPTRFETNFRFLQVFINTLECVMYGYNGTTHSKTNNRVYMECPEEEKKLKKF